MDTRTLDEEDVAEEGRHVEAGLIGLIPCAQGLVGKRVGRRDGAEEVHPPLCARGRAVVDVEEAQGNLHVRRPDADVPLQVGGGDESVSKAAKSKW